MKKIYGFLGAAALLMMVGCSKDDADGAQTPDAAGDFYMTMTITPSNGTGTRTQTDNEGSEVGKERENKITNALIIVAEEDGTGYKAVASAEILSTDLLEAASNSYVASFKMVRADLVTALNGQESKQFQLFMIANPNGITVNKGDDVQGVFSVTSGEADKYWTDDTFLMTSSEVTNTTLLKTELQEGKHTTKNDALNLGEVVVQRAMSRFDLALAEQHYKFDASTANNTLKVGIEFDGVALVNMASQAYLFKITGTTPPTDDKRIMFGAETVNNYVFSPKQADNAWIYPLYTGLNTNAGKPTGVSVNLGTAFTYTTIQSILTKNDQDQPDYNAPSEPTATNPYYIWDYCMENTNYDKTNQYHGNTTGIIFRAKMTGTTTVFDGTNNVYAYNNVVIGPFETLKTYVANNQAGDEDQATYEMIKSRYKVAQGLAKTANGGQEVAETEQNLKSHLKEAGFTIFAPDNGTYYCYYIYWNRHNDNRDNADMGEMEFATVRNNIYKISVNKITKLGHPGDPNDDPDPEDPGTPDETTDFWGEVTCKVLDWVVRVNNVEF